MAFITAAELRTRVAAMLKQDGVDITDAWDVHIGDSVPAAYQDIVAALVERGLTLAQILTWARGREFNIDLGLYWTFVKAAGLHGYDDRWINKLDRRIELKTAFLVDTSGEPIEPDPDVNGDIGHGEIKRHARDRFTNADGSMKAT